MDDSDEEYFEKVTLCPLCNTVFVRFTISHEFFFGLETEKKICIYF
jgi:hypothetical protein